MLTMRKVIVISLFCAQGLFAAAEKAAKAVIPSSDSRRTLEKLLFSDDPAKVERAIGKEMDRLLQARKKKEAKEAIVKKVSRTLAPVIHANSGENGLYGLYSKPDDSKESIDYIQADDQARMKSIAEKEIVEYLRVFGLHKDQKAAGLHIKSILAEVTLAEIDRNC